MIDDRTPNLNLPLPNEDNNTLDDIDRLRTAITALDTAVAARELSANKGQPSGYASLDGGGKVPASQLPSYVDDVLEYANFAAFPITGESGKIYVAQDANKTYRWGGSAYVEISASPGSTDAVTEGASNLYFTAQRVRDALLTGLSLATNAAITATDSVLSALGKLQKQISDHVGASGTAHPAATGSDPGFMSSADKTKLDAVTYGLLFDELTITPSTNGQTVFAVTGGYVVGTILVFVNGTKFTSGDDFTATNGTSITLTAGINTTDRLEVTRFKRGLAA